MPGYEIITACPIAVGHGSLNNRNRHPDDDEQCLHGRATPHRRRKGNSYDYESQNKNEARGAAGAQPDHHVPGDSIPLGARVIDSLECGYHIKQFRYGEERCDSINT